MHSSNQVGPVSARIKKNAVQFGNKSANLMELDLLCQGISSNQIQIKIPEIFPLNDASVKKHLDLHAKEWRSEWNKFLALLTKKKNLFDNDMKLLLKEIQSIIKTCFEKHPFDISGMESKNFIKDDLLMVRSTGEEDTVNLANPGGNKSVAAIKYDQKSISKAIGVVAASYFSKKSIMQRILSGDSVSKEPFMPVLIQKMIGEKLEGEDTPENVVASGVMYAKKNIVRIDIAPGHGELIVNSKAPFDTYDVTKDKVIHAEIYKKPYRLIPTEIKDEKGNTKRKLKLVPNPESLQVNPTVSSSIASQIANVGETIANHYGMAMDIEFVYDGKNKVLNIVQARPIPTQQKNIRPSAIAPSQWKKIKDNTGIPKIKVSVITSAGSQSKIITHINQIYIADTIEIALKEYLNDSQMQKNIRVILVKNPAPSTSHEAAQFTAMGIPVVQAEPFLIEQYLKEKNIALIVDTQHRTIINWKDQAKAIEHVEKELKDNKMISTGLFVSPLNPKKTLLKIDKIENPEIEKNIRKYLENISSIKINTKMIYSGASQCIDVLEGSEWGKDNKLSFTALKALAVIFQKIAKSKQANEKNSPHKALFINALQSIAEIDICLTEFSAGKDIRHKDEMQSHLLDLINKLKALVVNPGEENLFSNSILQLATRKKAESNIDPNLFLTKNAKSYYVEFKKLAEVALNQEIKNRWDSFSVYCSRYPKTRELLAKYIKIFTEFNMQSELINHCFNQRTKEYSHKQGALYLFKEMETTIQELNTNDLFKNQEMIASLERCISDWSNPAKFDKLFKLYEENTKILINKINLEKSMSDIARNALLKQVNYLADVMDKSIKSLKGSQEYTSQLAKVVSFVKLLNPYHQLMEKCMQALPSEWYDEWRKKMDCNDYNEKNAMITKINEIFIEKSKDISKKQLQSSGKICIASARVGGSASFERQVVENEDSITLEDLFSLFHQNILSCTRLLGKKGKFFNVDDLPGAVKNIINKLEGNSSIECLSITHTHPRLQFEYNIPLKNHSAKLFLEFDTKEETLKINFHFYGKNWEGRMDVMATIAGLEGLFLKAIIDKKPVFNEDTLSVEVAWKLNKSQINSFANYVNPLIANYSFCLNNYVKSTYEQLLANIYAHYNLPNGRLETIKGQIKELITDKKPTFDRLQQLIVDKFLIYIKDGSFDKFNALKNYFSDSFVKELVQANFSSLSKFFATQFFQYAKAGDLTKLQSLESVLSDECIKILLKATDQDGNTPIHWATRNGHNHVTRLFLSKDKENFQLSSHNNKTFNYLDNIVLYLSELIDKKDYSQLTMYFNEYEDIPYRLLNYKKESENYIINYFKTKFIEYIKTNKLQELQNIKNKLPAALFESILITEDKNGDNGLIWAAYIGNAEIVNWLISIDKDQKLRQLTNHHGYNYEYYVRHGTMRNLANKQAFEEIAKLLVDTPELFVLDSKQDESYLRILENQMISFAKTGDIANLKKLLQVSSYRNFLGYKEPNGDTVLHYAARNGYVDIINYLTSIDDTKIFTDLKYTNQLSTGIKSLVEKGNFKRAIANLKEDKYLSSEISKLCHKTTVDALYRQFLKYAASNNLSLLKDLYINLTDDLKKSILEFQNDDGDTALNFAAKNSNNFMIDYLLEIDKSQNLQKMHNINGLNYIDYINRDIIKLALNNEYLSLTEKLAKYPGASLTYSYISTNAKNIIAQQFMTFVLKGDAVSLVKMSKELSPDIFNALLVTRDEFGDTPLIKAAINGDKNIIEWMLAKDKSGNLKKITNKNNYDYEYYLRKFELKKLIISGSYQEIHKLSLEYPLNRIVDKELTNLLGHMFMDYARTGALLKMQEMEKFLPNEIFKNVYTHIDQDNHKDTALTWAAYKRFYDIIHYLLKLDVDGSLRKIKDTENRTYADYVYARLFSLARSKNYVAIGAQLEQFPDIDISSQIAKNSLESIIGKHFHASAQIGDLSQMKIIAQNLPLKHLKKILLYKDENGDIPLFWAANQGHIEVVKWLLSIDIDDIQKNVKNTKGWDYLFNITAYITELLKNQSYTEAIAAIAIIPEAALNDTILSKKIMNILSKQFIKALQPDGVLPKDMKTLFMNKKFVKAFEDVYLKEEHLILADIKILNFLKNDNVEKLAELSQMFSNTVLNKILNLRAYKSQKVKDVLSEKIIKYLDVGNTDKIKELYCANLIDGFQEAVAKYLISKNQKDVNKTLRNKEGFTPIDLLNLELIKYVRQKNYGKICDLLSEFKDLSLDAHFDKESMTARELLRENLNSLEQLKDPTYTEKLESAVVSSLCNNTDVATLLDIPLIKQKFIEFAKNGDITSLQTIKQIFGMSQFNEFMTAKDLHNDTALTWAAFKGQIPIVRWLLEQSHSHELQPPTINHEDETYLDCLQSYINRLIYNEKFKDMVDIILANQDSNECQDMVILFKQNLAKVIKDSNKKYSYDIIKNLKSAVPKRLYAELRLTDYSSIKTSYQMFDQNRKVENHSMVQLPMSII